MKSYKEELNKILSNKNYSRREFNNTIKLMDIFLEKDSLEVIKSKKGAYAPKWELEQIRKVILPDINKSNLEFKKQNENNSKFKEKKKLNPNETRKRKLNFDYKSQSDWDMFVKTFSDFNRSLEVKTENTKNGYYKALENELGKDGELGALAIKGILDQLPDEIISANALYNPNAQFRFVYSKDDYKIRFKNIKNEWTRILKDYNKEQLKNAK